MTDKPIPERWRGQTHRWSRLVAEELYTAEAERDSLRAERELFSGYVTAMLRLRRHKRTMRETKCEDRDGPPCWLSVMEGELDAGEMCDRCLMRQVAYHFRGEALKEVGQLRRKIIKLFQSTSPKPNPEAAK